MEDEQRVLHLKKLRVSKIMIKYFKLGITWQINLMAKLSCDLGIDCNCYDIS